MNNKRCNTIHYPINYRTCVIIIQVPHCIQSLEAEGWCQFKIILYAFKLAQLTSLRVKILSINYNYPKVLKLAQLTSFLS